MPIYDRHCSECDEIFEVTCRIAEKENNHACPYCGGTHGEWRPTSCMTSIRPDRLMTAKKDGGFNEVLAKIKERNKRSNLDSGRNIASDTAMG